AVGYCAFSNERKAFLNRRRKSNANCCGRNRSVLAATRSSIVKAVGAAACDSQQDRSAAAPYPVLLRAAATQRHDCNAMTVEQVKPFSLAACISAFRRITLPVWFGFAGIVLLTLIAYWPAIHGGFIWDDDSYVTQNTLLHDLDGLRRIWIPRQTPQYYPAVFTSFWIEYQLWGLNPLGYHLVNVLLHIGNALLVWRLAVVLRIPGGV